MKKYLKLRKHTFKNIHKFSECVTDKPVFKEGLVFSNELFHVNSKTCVLNACGSARGRLMPALCCRDKIANAPPPGMTTPGNAGGGGGGWAPLELIDA